MLSDAEGAWMEDFEAAKAKAKAEGKDLLIDFTGSDWCHWCVKLKEEVFDHESFTLAASKSFIFVELDFPNSKPQSDEIKAQNAALAKKYNIQGYPTILLTDHEGVVYGRTGYQAGGPEVYLKHLESIRDAKSKRAEALAAANKLEGMAKAEKLGEILTSLMESQIEEGQAEIVAEIKKLDPEDSKGLIAAYEFPNKLAAVEQTIKSTGDFDKALAELNGLLPAANKPAQKQQIYMFMAMIYMRGKQDQEQTMAHYKKAADADPESDLSKQIYQALEQQAAQKKTQEAGSPAGTP